MSEENKQPKSAFPVYAKDDGMTLRDWFAGMALQALIIQLPNQQPGLITRDNIASESYKVADAMMEEREKRQ